MADRGILFSAPMVRALLDGRKTQTRRLLKPQPEVFPVDDAGTPCDVGLLHVEGDRLPRVTTGLVITKQEVRFAIGDRLWVREAWHAARSLDRTPPRDIPRDASIEHAATARSYAEIGLKGRLRPGMFMPRWASRLTLTVTDVRVQRLQEISEADALAEGVDLGAAARHARGLNREWIAGHCYDCEFWSPVTEWKLPGCGYRTGDESDFRPRLSSGAGCSHGFKLREAEDPKRFQYQFLWNSLHYKTGEHWEDNPFIVAISFDVRKGNIDEESQA